jgi:hypothetical protein
VRCQCSQAGPAEYPESRADSKDYGQEVIDILLQVMENERDKLVVILAGYKDRMDEFFTSEPKMGPQRGARQHPAERQRSRVGSWRG